MNEVSLEQVRRVAELANLELSAEEEPRMQRDLNAILEHIAQLSELNTSNIPPMEQVSDVLEHSGHSENGELLRIDTVLPSIDRSSVLRSAPDTDGRFFKVPKVIER